MTRLSVWRVHVATRDKRTALGQTVKNNVILLEAEKTDNVRQIARKKYHSVIGRRKYPKQR